MNLDSFAYYLAWAILATQVTLLLLIVMHIVRRVVGFAEFLWQEYVWSKIKRGWRRLTVGVITRPIETHKIAPDEVYKNEKSLMLHEDPYFGPPTQMLKKAAKTTRKRAAKGKEIEEFAGNTRG